MGLAGGLTVVFGGLLYFATGYHWSRHCIWRAHHVAGVVVSWMIIACGFAMMLVDIYLQARAGNIV